MAITRQAQQELDQIYAKYREKYQGHKENYFPLLYISKKFHCKIEDIITQVAFGKDECGLEAYYLERESKNLYLYQFRWSEDANQFKRPLELLAQQGIDKIFGEGNGTKSDLIANLKAELFECQDLIERIYVHLVFKGSTEQAYNSQGLKERLENLENKKFIIEKFFKNRPIFFQVEFISDDRRLPTMPAPDQYSIPVLQRMTYETSDHHKKLHLGLIPLMELHRIYKSLGQKFLSRNIRAGLSPDNPPNRKIREALAEIVLKRSTLPETFIFNHNGVTLAAEKVEFENGHATITVPRLLNGAQTVTSLGKFLEDHADQLSAKNNLKIMESIHVIAKIVEYSPQSDFVTNVTICNNQQNSVEPWNLRANDRIQCDFEDKFRDEVSIFYSRQENAFQTLSEEERQELGLDHKDIKIKPLGLTFLAVQGEIDRMSRLHDVFESQKLYEETFKPSYLHADARKIVIAYKVHLVLNSPMERLAEKASQKLFFVIKRARNLVWALLVQALFNDSDLPSLLETYGTTLTSEKDFREHLKHVASARILPILREVLEEESYKQKIEEEKYGFLRTKELFKRCMNVAQERYGWAKKSF